ncbi:MAG: ABC transporter substrate-binding protein [Ideonella sp.]|nr:ABC transporter substrate-binding protein [Ideonella sp.]
MSRRRWLGLGLAGAASPRLVLSAPEGLGPVPRKAVVVGQTLALDAGRNASAVAVRQGIETALQVVRLNGGIRGRPLWLRTLDDQGDPEKATRHAQRLVNDGALLLFAPLGDRCASAVLAQARSSQTPLMAPLSGLSRFYEAVPSGLYPVRASAAAECTLLWRQAQSLGMKRLAILHVDDGFGLTLRDDARTAASSLGLGPPVSLSITPGSPAEAMKPLVERARSADAVLLTTGGPAAAEFVRQAKHQGLRAVLMGLNGAAMELLPQLGPAAAGLQFSQVVPNPWTSRLLWVQQYQAAFKATFRGQAFSHLSLEAYVSTLALAEALRASGPQPTSDGLREALNNTTLALDGFPCHFLDGQARGSRYVDTALVGHDGRWRQ